MIGDFSVETIRSLPVLYVMALAIGASVLVTAAIVAVWLGLRRRSSRRGMKRFAAAARQSGALARAAAAPAIPARELRSPAASVLSAPVSAPAPAGPDRLARTVVSLSAALDKLDRAIVGCVELANRVASGDEERPERIAAALSPRPGAGLPEGTKMPGSPGPAHRGASSRLALTEEQLRLYRHAGRLKKQPQEPEKVLQPAR